MDGPNGASGRQGRRRRPSIPFSTAWPRPSGEPSGRRGARDSPCPAAASGMGILEELGVMREPTGRKRGRLFGYDRYLAIPSEETWTP